MPVKRSAPWGPWLHRFMTACITASIELATLARNDLSYIPQSAILARANAELRCPVIITDPATGKRMIRALIPDAVFGLRYQLSAGDRLRFFAVEADRATEPTTSANWNRKSFERNLVQYHAYVQGGAYRDHLELTVPLLVLNVLSDAKRMERMVEFVAGRYPQGSSFMPFRAWEDFGAVFRPPVPILGFLNDEWSRSKLLPIRVDQASSASAVTGNR